MTLSRIGRLIFVCAFASIPVCSAYSPLEWIDPTNPVCGPLSFELQSQVGADGAQHCTLTVTVRDRDFHGGVDLARTSILDPDGETVDNVKGGRRLSFHRTDRTIFCEFTLTREEANDPDLAFYFMEPVPARPNVTICFGWIPDFLNPKQYSKQSRFDRIERAAREQAASRDAGLTPDGKFVPAHGAPEL